jgi:hypothetical protein
MAPDTGVMLTGMTLLTFQKHGIPSRKERYSGEAGPPFFEFI